MERPRWHKIITPLAPEDQDALPGYQTFETDINPLANQNVQIKTDLVKNGAPLAEPLVQTETSDVTPSSAVRDPDAPPQR